MNADGEEGGSSGNDVGYGFYFSTQPGAQGNTFFQHQIADKKDAEFAVNDQQKEKRGKNPVNYKTQEAGDLHESIGKGIEEFAKIAHFVVFTGDYAVQQIGYLRDDKN